MSNRVIKKQWYNFYHGLDHHNGLYWVNVWTRLAPVGAPPVPIPPGMMMSLFSVHGVQYMATDWFSMDDKSHANILADGSPVFSRNHTIKRTIHCPPSRPAPSSSGWRRSRATASHWPAPFGVPPS